MNCFNNTTALGEVPIMEEGTPLPLTADISGTWGFMTSFNGLYKYSLFQATVGQNIVVPLPLNEHYTYTFKLYKPDNSWFNDTCYNMMTVPMLPDIEYSCPVADAQLNSVKTGKKQFLATTGQTEIGNNVFINALQLVVFIEGAIRQEGNGTDEYHFNATTGAITFNEALIEGQKITVLYFR
jgi:hypothetical protein